MLRVKWALGALLDFEHGLIYLEQQNPSKALEMALIVQSAESLLQEFPLLAREGKIFGTREYVLKKFPYILVFRVLPEELEILAFFHTSRRPFEVESLH